jgi:hypothetical protein
MWHVLEDLPPDGGIYAGARQANHMQNHGFIFYYMV